ncbi:MAG: hypothetical protein HOH80_11100 [Rhodospirillaceae bacterium]|jgi:hypothetical protein|nr:hypothetical protein [Rhodospirillaceae bacterium]MBT4118736.1 hypothetical protein [Rhodospirillaceae bacterium]MBT4672470.1 hypothetical protein [Rhodospirillaceae bacterium]MBT4718046.1 hypothetical protein [Rhodospirillaceae bacterium]MBT5839535.1 hypothetical protein [Rhodospirillaceae bacterium]
MDCKRHGPILIGAALFLSACSFSSDSLLPSLTGEDPAGGANSGAQQASPKAAPAGQQLASNGTPVPAAPGRTQMAQSSPPKLGTTDFKTPGVTAGKNTGTFVGQKVTELRAELNRMQANVSKSNGDLQKVRSKTVGDSQRYHNSVGSINARLQVGTTPGNPILVEQFNQALTLLDQIGEDISNMNVVTSQVAGDSALASFLAEKTRAAFRLSGAVDEDHRQLAILEDEVNRTVVLIDRLLKELSEDIQRQTNYVATERSNLNTLSSSIKTGEILGASLTNRALNAATGGAPQRRSRSTLGRRPLVVIRFDRQDVAYDQALYSAVSRALERRPNATFELVAVAPTSGGAARIALNTNKARRSAESVLRSLQRMGMPAERVGLSARTSQTAQTNEVHLYLN